jgi:hypothetical protein
MSCESRAPDFLGQIPQLHWMRDLFLDNVEPAQPFGLVVAGPQRCIVLPKALHLVARLPIANGSLHSRGETLGQRSFQAAQADFPFCAVFFSTAASSLWNASANNFTPSAVSFVVTSLIEIPVLARLSITFCAPATSSVRLFRSFP